MKDPNASAVPKVSSPLNPWSERGLRVGSTPTNFGEEQPRAPSARASSRRCLPAHSWTVHAMPERSSSMLKRVEVPDPAKARAARSFCGALRQPSLKRLSSMRSCVA